MSDNCEELTKKGAPDACAGLSPLQVEGYGVPFTPGQKNRTEPAALDCTNPFALNNLTATANPADSSNPSTKPHLLPKTGAEPIATLKAAGRNENLTQQDPDGTNDGLARHASEDWIVTPGQRKALEDPNTNHNQKSREQKVVKWTTTTEL